MMNIDLNLLEKRFPFFELSLRYAIAEKGIFQQLEEGEEIIREGQYIKSVPLVLEGLVRISRLDDQGRELLLYYLHPGEACAMSLTCCMGHTQSNVRAVAEAPSLLLRIPTPLLDQWMTTYQSWKEYVMYAYHKRFDELLETIDSIAFMKMDERLEKFFADRFRSTGSTLYTGTHQDIAFSLNTSREVISRLLKKLEKDGSITLSRNKIDYAGMVK